MMDNRKIAKELNRIAKTLVSNNVANNDGLYKNFTGIIDWNESTGKVSKATFELSNEKGIIWHDGIWHNGVWDKGWWQDGTWKKGTWYNGTWKDGTWKDGTWRDGIWKDGTWEKGNWKDGIWEYGTWEKGNWVKGEDKRGVEHLDSPDNW